MNLPLHFHQALQQCGLIAILRGLRPEEAVAIGRALYDPGFRLIEVPLNSPDPLASIRALRDALPADCLIGAGTVLRPEQCAEIAAAGGQLNGAQRGPWPLKRISAKTAPAPSSSRQRCIRPVGRKPRWLPRVKYRILLGLTENDQ